MPALTRDPLDFAGALVVVTGVGRAGQLGEALAAAFAARGATLALVDLDAAQVAARADALRAGGEPAAGAVSAHAGNLADPDDARRVAAEVAAAHPGHAGVRALIHAAGGFGMTGPLDESDPAAWHRQFTINLETAWATTRAFLPALRVARGALVYFASVAALPGGSPAGMSAYAAAKSGVVALMRAVAAEERPHGVRANAIAPTAIRTAANEAAMGADKAFVERDAVADVALFLASPMARTVSGEVLRLA